ncbi:acetate/propionate family kinase [Colwellia sp. MB02u-10]|uniref:acetate/propionate family kinase n=1 Tax=Colwellia sp. MB02u-10 TaxID=2759828 RepID=UPI0015F3A4EF|nr:acetate/propionate family kinase [Colwellia sp. MB02u-10]MBA6342551.1 acetate/propionate family kinase [Colwellia sp. MB02u-10]
MNDAVLVINAGSSSIKFALYDFSTPNSQALLSGKVVNIGQRPTLYAIDAKGNDLTNNDLAAFNDQTTHETLIQWLLEWLNHHNQGYEIKAVGHRVVHGGRDFLTPTKLTVSVVERLKKLIPLAPLHQPHNLAAIEAIFNWAPELPQVACFDTSFHSTQATLAQLFALPREYSDKGIIRYGFHGLSYQYIASCLPQYLGTPANGRVIVAHLGNGASMCALKQRQSVATTMGFTALDGLMMGQRCGSLDAGVVIHLLRHYKMSVEDVEHMLYKESGLLGVSGISSNMQVLEQSNDPQAKQAIDLFCYRAARELSALVSTISGIDALVFTAGIGENSATIRGQICQHLTWLGVSLDASKNRQHKSVISQGDSGVKVLVIPTNEEIIIAQATQKLLMGR